MTGSHEGSPEFRGLLSQDDMSVTKVILLLGSSLVALGFLQAGRSMSQSW